MAQALRLPLPINIIGVALRLRPDRNAGTSDPLATRIDLKNGHENTSFFGASMLGFVLFPADDARQNRLERIISKFKTIEPERSFPVGGLQVALFKTPSPNNYFVEAGAQVFVATGTLMLANARGQNALKEIAKRTENGETLESLYDRLRGPFILLHLDKAKGSAHVVMGRDGLIPCYESVVDGQFVIGSSLLLLASLSNSPVDPVGVQEFAHGGSCLDGRTLFRDVRRIPAASKIDCLGASLQRKVLWRATVSSPYLPDSDAAIVDRMHELFASALSTERHDANKPVATDLTAGTDSRTVLSFLLKTGHPVETSTAGDPKMVDVRRAQQIAAKAGIKHFWNPVESTVEFEQALLDDCIEHSDGAMNAFGLCTKIPYFIEKSKRYDILFGGNGGPLFKDHYWLFEFNQINKMAEPNWARHVKYSLTEAKVRDSLFPGGIHYLQHMQDTFLRYSKKIAGANNQKLDFTYYDLRTQYSASSQFAFANRFMDVYHPMCDGKLVEYSMSIRPWIRQRARMQAELIYRNNRAIAWVPTDNYHPCVPDTGVRSVLRLTRAVRYVKAARRKLKDFVFDKKQSTPDSKAVTFAQSILKTGLATSFQNPEELRLAPLLNLAETQDMFTSVAAGAHSGYSQRLMAAEAFIRKVEALGERTVLVSKG